MTGRPRLAFLTLCLAACAHPRRGQPNVERPVSLFPLAQSWLLPLEASLHGPLVTDGARLFFVTRPGGLQGVDAATGQPLWQLTEHFGVLGACPGLLAVREPDGTIWAREPETGSARWKAASGVRGDLPPALDAERTVVGGEGIALLESETGRVLWSRTEPEATTVPVLGGDSILLGHSDGTLRAWQAETGAVRWAFVVGGRLSAPAVVDDRGRLFLGTPGRRLQSLSFADGKKRWSWRVGADVPFQGVVTKGTVLFASNEAVLYSFRAGNGHLAWRAPLPSRPLSGPVLSRGAVLIACHGTRPSESLLLGFDVLTGRRLGEMKTRGEIATGPLAVGDHIVLGLRDPRALVGLRPNP